MRTRTAWMVLMVPALLLAGSAWPAAGQHGRRGGHGRHQEPGVEHATPAPPGRAFLAHLDLTDEQQAQVKELREKVRTARRALRKEIVRARHDLRGALLEDDPDMATLRKLTERIGDLKTQMQIKRLEHRMGIRKILTPEQRDRLSFQRHRHGRRHGCGPRGHSQRGHGCGHPGPGWGHQGQGCSHPGPGWGYQGQEWGHPGHGWDYGPFGDAYPSHGWEDHGDLPAPGDADPDEWDPELEW